MSASHIAEHPSADPGSPLALAAWRIGLGVLIAWGCLARLAVAAEPPGEVVDPTELGRRVQQLLQQLDADRFAERQAAQEALLELGEAGLPHYGPVPRGASAERRQRQRTIVRTIHRRWLREAFDELARQEDARIDVERAMWLIARIDAPTLSQDSLTRQLDQLAERVRDRLGRGRQPSRAPPREVLDAMRKTLFEDFGLRGAVANYDHPDNSSLHQVLRRRQGLPILLSELMVAVGRRLDVPLVGLALPGRYMLKYDGNRAPDGLERADLIVDAYGGGHILSLEEVRKRVPALDPERHLTPPSRRETVARMLRNLASDFAAVGDVEQANQVLGYLEIMESGGPGEPGNRGVP